MRLGLAVFVGSLSLVPAAQAATRYASPAGSGTACTQAVPCNLQTAIGSAPAGAEVIVQPGDYGSQGAPIGTSITNSSAIDVHGVDFMTRPTLYTSASPGLSLSSSNARLSHLGIVNTVANQTALNFGGALADRIVASATGSSDACLLDNSATLRNSICWHKGTGKGVSALDAPGVKLIGVTAIAGGIAVELNEAMPYEVSNSVMQGGTADIRALGMINPTTVTIDHSNYDTMQEGGGASITDLGSGTNQTEPPQLADQANGDFHQLSSSPTIDAGAFGSAGTLDFDGELRVMGAAPDIGADESAPAPTPNPSPGLTTGPSAPTIGAPATPPVTKKPTGKRKCKKGYRLKKVKVKSKGKKKTKRVCKKVRRKKRMKK
jgi:hypothetical protein